jgi:dTDP-4-dehydrorhamnose reductase
VNPYGRAKWAAERAVRAAGGCVVRTSLVYRPRPPDPTNQDLILAPLARGERPRLFTDEYRSPIYLDDLVDALLEVAAWPPGAWTALPAGGILHVAGPERLDRYTFGCRLAPFLGVERRQLEAATLAASGLARPADCSLDSTHARERLRTVLRPLSAVLGG